MSARDSDPEDAITKEEVTEAVAVAETSSAGASRGTKRNAFTVLMAPKPKRPSQPPAPTPGRFLGEFQGRDVLAAYTANPTSAFFDNVIYHNESFVVIKDVYPKSSVHTLLLPRSPRSRMHPFDAFDDPEFLASVQAEAARLKYLVGTELQRMYGLFSAQENRYNDVLDGKLEWNDRGPPVGRDWAKEVLVGVHTHPSLNNLHVHVLSPDMVSESMRTRKHYLSFTTPFLVDIADFPLAANDPRRQTRQGRYFEEDMRCWRCKRNFGNQLKKLKDHLEDELELWKVL